MTNDVGDALVWLTAISLGIGFLGYLWIRSGFDDGGLYPPKRKGRRRDEW